MSATICRIELQIMEGYLTLSDGGRKELKQECLNQGEHVYVHVSGLCDNAEGITLGKDYIDEFHSIRLRTGTVMIEYYFLFPSVQRLHSS